MNLEHVVYFLNTELYVLEEFKETLTSGRYAAYSGATDEIVAQKLIETEDQIKEFETALRIIDEN